MRGTCGQCVLSAKGAKAKIDAAVCRIYPIYQRLCQKRRELLLPSGLLAAGAGTGGGLSVPRGLVAAESWQPAVSAISYSFCGEGDSWKEREKVIQNKSKVFPEENRKSDVSTHVSPGLKCATSPTTAL